MHKKSIVNSSIATQHLRRVMALDVEEFWAIALDSCKHSIAIKCLFRGTVDSCLFHPRDVFRFACMSNASALLVAHNHPSGDCSPSPSDNKVTWQLLEAGQLMEIPILDHLILARDSYFSYADSGLVNYNSRSRKINHSAPRDPREA